jgi:glycosyltransferase involved in cell wall biosynthesis
MAAPGWASAAQCLQGGRLSVIMPAYNLGPSIADNIDRVRLFLDMARIPFEIVPVDDGSHDDTAGQIQAAALANPDVIHPVLIAQNGGKGNAMRQGLAASQGTHILLLDGDLDLDPAMLPAFFEAMQQHRADIVIGSKRHPKSQIEYPWRRRLASAVYFSIVKLLIGLPVTDTQTGMKLFRREALQWAFDRMLVKQFAFDLELLAIAHDHGYRVAEAPIRMSFGDKVGCLNLHNVKQVMLDTLAIFYRLRILKYYPSVEPVRMPDPPPLVSVVIACPAPSDYLTQCLAGLGRQTYRRLEVLVLPDGPADLPSDGLDLRVIVTGRIRPAEKRNLGIREARGEIVAFLDDDTIPVPSWLEQAVKYFSKPDIGGVGGPGTTPEEDPWLARAGGRVYAHPLVSGGYRYRYHPDRVRNVDDIPSCNLLVRTSILRELGGFRTDFWPGEDTILCADIVHRLHKRLVYDPWAAVAHHRRALFGPHLRQIGRYALHRGYFARRFPNTSRRIGYMIPSLFVLGLAIGFGLAFLHPWLMAAYVAGVCVYLAITFLATFSHRPALWLATWLGVMATHVFYGLRFLQGLLRPRMPGEVQRFDHPSEIPPPAG